MVDGYTLTKITSLALADSVNPCAIAVLSMVLISILIAHPNKKRKVLYGGLAFIAAVYIGYLFYGVVLVQFFKVFTEVLKQNSAYLYKGFAILAMVLGALNIKDYFSYTPGGLATEMPMSIRPYAKLAINKITSPTGAFVIGFLVTIFLLPCTIGPYVVASGLLASLGFIGSIPWLLYYNLVFVLPMIFIVGLIYYGFGRVEDVAGWKERNIRKLHLVAGILLFLVGVALLAGWL